MSDAGTVITHDLDLAALLLAEGAELLSVEPGASPGRREFLLRSPRSQELVDAYTSGTAIVGLEAFCGARRALLDRLHRAERVSVVAR